jgi:hypothetical protein
LACAWAWSWACGILFLRGVRHKLLSFWLGLLLSYWAAAAAAAGANWLTGYLTGWLAGWLAG